MPTLLHHIESLACHHGVPQNNGTHCPACYREQMADLRIVPRPHPADEDRLARDLDVYLCTPDEPHRLSDFVEASSAHPGVIPPWADPHIVEDGDQMNQIWPVEVK